MKKIAIILTVAAYLQGCDVAKDNDSFSVNLVRYGSVADQGCSIQAPFYESTIYVGAESAIEPFVEAASEYSRDFFIDGRTSNSSSAASGGSSPLPKIVSQESNKDCVELVKNALLEVGYQQIDICLDNSCSIFQVANEVEAVEPELTEWEFSESLDPFTDAREIIVSGRLITDPLYDVQIAYGWSATRPKEFAKTISVFDKNGVKKAISFAEIEQRLDQGPSTKTTGSMYRLSLVLTQSQESGAVYETADELRRVYQLGNRDSARRRSREIASALTRQLSAWRNRRANQYLTARSVLNRIWVDNEQVVFEVNQSNPELRRGLNLIYDAIRLPMQRALQADLEQYVQLNEFFERQEQEKARAAQAAQEARGERVRKAAADQARRASERAASANREAARPRPANIPIRRAELRNPDRFSWEMKRNYPSAARRGGVEGDLTVSITVDTIGG